MAPRLMVEGPAEPPNPDLQAWVGTPAIYVFDCSAAGLIVNTFKLLLEQRHMQQLPPGHAGRAGMTQGNYDSPASASTGGGDSVAGNPGAREVILLAACGANELLPQSPDLPADVFTACLTTPIKVGTSLTQTNPARTL